MKTAFLFPGQGSQSIGMLSELAAAHPQVVKVFAEASEAIGIDLWALCQTGPQKQLNKTEYTQPAMLAADIAVWQVWQSLNGGLPDFMAGHSLGEYAALVAAGSISLSDGIRLVNRRGQLMQAASPAGVGAMAAIIGLDDKLVEAACEQASSVGIVSAANYNSPGQVVIAGEKAAVEAACQLCSDAGARRAMLLAVSVPSHCALMQPAAEQFAASLEALNISATTTAVLHNVDASVAAGAEAIAEHLLAQLSLPVRWSESIQSMLDQGVQAFAECGPGKVLSGLNKRIARRVPITPLQTPDLLQATVQQWSTENE
ncbi:MAG: ACP S-malonyltransferase [Xanthomonadales bacterium]|nr:ACP S-malonyltransferase [Xanthomonadales bacterium]